MESSDSSRVPASVIAARLLSRTALAPRGIDALAALSRSRAPRTWPRTSTVIRRCQPRRRERMRCQRKTSQQQCCQHGLAGSLRILSGDDGVILLAAGAARPPRNGLREGLDLKLRLICYGSIGGLLLCRRWLAVVAFVRGQPT